MDKLVMKHIHRPRSVLREEFAVLKPAFEALGKNAKLVSCKDDEGCIPEGSQITVCYEETVDEERVVSNSEFSNWSRAWLK